MELKKSYFAELLGTMTLVLLGCGTAMYTHADVVATAFAFGLSVVAMAYTIGKFSGCHINPAITLAAWLSKRIDGKDAVCYVIFQVLGAILGALLLYAITPEETFGKEPSYGANYINEDIVGTGFFAEFIFTFIFVLVVLATTDEKYGAGERAGFFIGLTLVLVHLACINITGTSVNPARSFGPAIFAGGDYIGQVWLYIIAPCLGAVVSAGVWGFFTDKIKINMPNK